MNFPMVTLSCGPFILCMADATRFFVYPDENPDSFQLQSGEDSGDDSSDDSSDARGATDRAFAQYMQYAIRFLQGPGGPLEVLT